VPRLLAILLALSLAVPPSAGAQELSTRQRALVLLRVLAYDRALRARAGAEVRVAVVFRPGHPASERERDELLAAFSELEARAVVAGLPVRADAVPYDGGADLVARLSAPRAAALYACAGLEDHAPAIAVAARTARLLTAAGARGPVEQGLAVGLVDRGNRAGLLVNVRAALDQGIDLDSALLAVAERVDPAPAAPR
jgi:hypothetical protein